MPNAKWITFLICDFTTNPLVHVFQRVFLFGYIAWLGMRWWWSICSGSHAMYTRELTFTAPGRPFAIILRYHLSPFLQSSVCNRLVYALKAPVLFYWQPLRSFHKSILISAKSTVRIPIHLIQINKQCAPLSCCIVSRLRWRIRRIWAVVVKQRCRVVLMLCTSTKYTFRSFGAKRRGGFSGDVEFVPKGLCHRSTLHCLLVFFVVGFC